VPDWVPTPGNRRYMAAIHRLDALVYRIIREREPGGNDLLSMLLESDMSDIEVRDEVMTFFMAGHETTALALTWGQYLLALNPRARERLFDEVDRVLGDRPPRLDDLPALAYTRAVVDETLRMYPPAWIGPRRSIEPFELHGVRVPGGVLVNYCSWASHHLPEVFPDPFRFRPDRFLPDARAALPKGAYVPFGGGSRTCIGMRFGLLEVRTIAATILSRFRLELAEPERELSIRQMPTLSPRGGLPVIVRPSS
jgi:retinoid hydroxylase